MSDSTLFYCIILFTIFFYLTFYIISINEVCCLLIEGFLVPGACLVATGYVDCNAPLAVTLIVIAVGVSGMSFAGWSVNHLDLAPAYAGYYFHSPTLRI